MTIENKNDANRVHYSAALELKYRCMLENPSFIVFIALNLLARSPI